MAAEQHSVVGVQDAVCCSYANWEQTRASDDNSREVRMMT
jgi:hypothetical protein